MSVRISAPGGAREIRRVALDAMLPEVPYVVDLEVVSDDAMTSCLLACSVEGWAEVSVDDGVTWTALGASVQSGFELGPLVADEPTPFKVSVTVPSAGGPYRRQVLELLLGLGI